MNRCDTVPLAHTRYLGCTYSPLSRAVNLTAGAFADRLEGALCSPVTFRDKERYVALA